MHAEAAPIEFFSRDADAGDIPASLATCRTPVPPVNNCLAFCTFTVAIGRRPGLMDSARLAACPRNMRFRLDWRRWNAIMLPTSKSDMPLPAAVSIPWSSSHRATPATRRETSAVMFSSEPLLTP